VRERRGESVPVVADTLSEQEVGYAAVLALVADVVPESARRPRADPKEGPRAATADGFGPLGLAVTAKPSRQLPDPDRLALETR
jgi:hypothetical protein